MDNALYFRRSLCGSTIAANFRPLTFGRLLAQVPIDLSVATAKLVGREWWQRFNDHLGQLRFFQAGAMIGEILPDLTLLQPKVP